MLHTGTAWVGVGRSPSLPQCNVARPPQPTRAKARTFDTCCVQRIGIAGVVFVVLGCFAWRLYMLLYVGCYRLPLFISILDAFDGQAARVAPLLSLLEPYGVTRSDALSCAYTTCQLRRYCLLNYCDIYIYTRE